ncbi:DUF4249 domain-containing protein [Hymenobacter properus]|uniref:DUF4249 domain-containing protein n=1 Tax=Hymenobacter properus TaxID=2791026 RepID=A0A931FL14_9BACT|nr:DUF4249 domain-containing protein [Hymenobacter properus]MBF9143668.1 DUF4249 domain-containing protein [Hymenobacter properus]MBR7722481.1 DUF4249 domain-containing protein [Microvirga sp. SRT04]
MKNLSLALLLAAAALAGCESDAGLPEPPHTPRVSLFYVLTQAPQDSSYQELFQQRQLYVSNSQHVFSTERPQGRTDAAVELRDAAGRVVERYRPVGSNFSASYRGDPGYYRPVLGFRPQPGQPYTLRATLPGLETAESTLTLPAAPTIESVSFQKRGATVYGTATGRLSVSVRDDAGADNYYLVFARALNAQGQPTAYGDLRTDEDDDSGISIDQFQLSSAQQQYSLGAYGIHPYADTNHNGERLTLNADVRYNTGCYTPGVCPPPAFIEVTVSSLTADAYNFYLSNRRYYDADGNPFAEPAPLAGNMRQGYGLFGGATNATYRVQIP